MIQQLDVDGVPTLLGPTAGPAHAGIVFRVGSADEPLARRGITHLIEHLTLHAAGVADYHQHLTDGTEYTIFHTRGTEGAIVAFLNGVCAALRDLPMGRFGLEKDVLRAEANGRGVSYNAAMPMWRHGARDYGTTSFPEWGLPALTENDLRDWVSRYFTKENAALWVAGDGVPQQLDLSLPAGSRKPTPEPSSSLAVMPASFAGSGDAVVWDAVVPRGPASAVFAGVLERVLFRELRQEAGLSYAVNTDYSPFADRAMITAVADALPEKQDQVLDGFVAVLAGMRDGRIDEADVAAVVARRAEALSRADDQGGRLPSLAFGLLVGRGVPTVEEAAAAIQAVTREAVAAVGTDAWATGLLLTPGTAEAGEAGITPAPTRSAEAVTGTEHASLDDPAARLIIGETGVSLVNEESTVTVLYADCAILRTWADGARQLIGNDGFIVHIEPTLYVGAYRTVRSIDGRVPAGVCVGLPARDSRRIPQPKSAQPEPKPSVLARVRALFRSTRS